jgi:hypothetical protein
MPDTLPATNLLPMSHPTYLRRFVRVLNAQGNLNGFFAPVVRNDVSRVRCNRARLKDGQLECRVIGERRWVRTLNPAYAYETPSAVLLCASRKP